MKSTAPPTFERLLGEILPNLDERYAKDGKQADERPLSAAMFVVAHVLVEVAGDTKDDYLAKPWFAAIYRPIHQWYERRYSEALTRLRRRPKVTGLILYLGTPIRFQVPLTVTEPGDSATFWVRFPTEVLSAEEPLSWVEYPPSISEMPPKRRHTYEEGIRSVATLLRGINNDLMTADLKATGNPRLVKQRAPSLGQGSEGCNQHAGDVFTGDMGATDGLRENH